MHNNFCCLASWPLILVASNAVAFQLSWCLSCPDLGSYMDCRQSVLVLESQLALCHTALALAAALMQALNCWRQQPSWRSCPVMAQQRAHCCSRYHHAAFEHSMHLAAGEDLNSTLTGRPSADPVGEQRHKLMTVQIWRRLDVWPLSHRHAFPASHCHVHNSLATGHQSGLKAAFLLHISQVAMGTLNGSHCSSAAIWHGPLQCAILGMGHVSCHTAHRSGACLFNL